MVEDDEGPRSSVRPISLSRKYGRLSDEGRAWEKERLKEAGLEDVLWDPEVECPCCCTGGPHRISEPGELLTLLMFLRG